MIARTARRLDHRTSLLWLAALLHRLSGLALAVFLPLHFLTLGLAIDGEARFDSFLRWSDATSVKLGEAMLVFLLAVHALGGLRLLAVENLAWHNGQKRNAALAALSACFVAVVFLAWIL
jgi:succinate dehydrogenase subunit D